jgi:hypothetical protein
MAYKPNVRRLVDDRDVDGLIHALRYPEDPEIRARAAWGLGKIGTVKTVESLIRSHLQDPDPETQQAALDALHQIIGGETDLAISAYTLPEDTWVEDKIVSPNQPQEESEGSEPGDEENPVEEDLEDDGDDLDDDDLEEDEEPESEAGDSGEIIWSENDIQALLSIIRVDHSRRKRLKAIQALSQIPNTRAIDALASITLWSEEKWLREAAREALSEIYGDSLDEVLQSYREASLEAGAAEDEDEGEDEDEEDDEVDDENEDENEDEVDFEDEEDYDDTDEDEVDEEEIGEDENAGADEGKQTLPSTSPGQPSPVIREEKAGWGAYLLLGLMLIIIVAGLVFLLSR